jgi:hypothetical protein
MFYFYFPPPFLPCSFPPILPYLYPIHFVLPLSVLTVICAAFLRVLAISLRLKPQPSRPLGLTLTATLCTVRPLYDRRARPPTAYCASWRSPPRLTSAYDWRCDTRCCAAPSPPSVASRPRARCTGRQRTR